MNKEQIKNVEKMIEREKEQYCEESIDLINDLFRKLSHLYFYDNTGPYHIKVADEVSRLVNKYFSVDELYSEEKIKEYLGEK